MKITSQILSAVLACSTVMAAPAPTSPAAPAANKQKLSPDAVSSDANTYVRAIVQWAGAPGTTSQELIMSLGGTIVKEFSALNAGVYVLPHSALAKLQASPSVLYVSLDRPIHKKLGIAASDEPASKSIAITGEQ